MKSTYSPASECSKADPSHAGRWRVGLRSYVTVLVVLGLTIIGSGCGPWASPGENAAEASRRRGRVLRVNHSEMMADVDKVLMLDEPSRLTDRNLP